LNATLFDPARHEPLVDRRWDADAARAAIAAIVDDTLAACSADGLWPPHPLDGHGSAQFAELYFGAAGVIYALDWLASAGAAIVRRDFGAAFDGLLARNLAEVGASSRDVDSLLVGRSGILLVRCRVAPSRAAADQLAASIAANASHPSLELLWGTPGTMHAALEMHERTGEARWAELFRRDVETLARSFLLHPRVRCHLWMQDFRGKRYIHLGAAHGFAGNAGVLVRGSALLPAVDRRWWMDRIVDTAHATAMREGAQANWPDIVVSPESPRSTVVVQWCHGAPGFVTSLADLPDPRLDDLLGAAGELVWAAGPLTKGAGLCHGTAGNGYAFLKLFRRTGKPLWLDRARAFAMHAIAQSDAHRRKYGMRHYSLMTGDPGLAIYLWNCIAGCDRFPLLDRTLAS